MYSRKSGHKTKENSLVSLKFNLKILLVVRLNRKKPLKTHPCLVLIGVRAEYSRPKISIGLEFTVSVPYVICLGV